MKESNKTEEKWQQKKVVNLTKRKFIVFQIK